MTTATAQDQALAHGFRCGHSGAHSSRTIMVADLAALFAHCPPSATRADYRTAIVDGNLLGKRTASTRQEAFERLSTLYLLDPAKAMFSGLRWYWSQGSEGRALLALLTAVARDPLLGATAPVILSLPLDAGFDKAVLIAALREIDPDRFQEGVLHKIATNAASSWTQAGFLVGRVRKHRARPALTPAVVAYALYLGSLEGHSGERLLDTRWTALLDHPRHQVEAIAQEAAARGLLDYRRAGSVRDISFRQLETARGQG